MGEGGISEVEHAQTKERATSAISDGENTLTRINDPINERILKDAFNDDEEIFKDILLDFLEPSKEIIAEIHSGFKEQSAEALMLAAHKLKSSALTVGAMRLGEVCKELEAAANSKNWEIINRDVPKLTGLMSEIENYISQL